MSRAPLLIRTALLSQGPTPATSSSSPPPRPPVSKYSHVRDAGRRGLPLVKFVGTEFSLSPCLQVITGASSCWQGLERTLRRAWAWSENPRSPSETRKVVCFWCLCGHGPQRGQYPMDLSRVCLPASGRPCGQCSGRLSGLKKKVLGLH